MIKCSALFVRSSQVQALLLICAVIASRSQAANVRGHPTLNNLRPRAAAFALSGPTPTTNTTFNQSCEQPDINSATWMQRGIDSYLQNLPNGTAMSLQVSPFERNSIEIIRLWSNPEYKK